MGDALDYANFFLSVNADVSSGSIVSLLVFSFDSVHGFSFSSHACVSQISVFGQDDSPGHSFLTGCPRATLNSALLFLSRTLSPTPHPHPSEPALPPLSLDDHSWPHRTPPITLDPVPGHHSVPLASPHTACAINPRVLLILLPRFRPLPLHAWNPATVTSSCPGLCLSSNSFSVMMAERDF